MKNTILMVLMVAMLLVLSPGMAIPTPPTPVDDIVPDVLPQKTEQVSEKALAEKDDADAPDDGFQTLAAQGCSLGSGTTVLDEAVATTGSLDGNSGDNCAFVFSTADGASHAKYTLDPTTPADYDLYIKVGSAPTTGDWDCRPFLGGGSSEVCQVANNGADVYAMVLHWSGSGAFTVTAESITPEPTCSLGAGIHELTDGVTTTASLTDESGANCVFEFTPDVSADIAMFTMTPATSDFDLYVKAGGVPTTSDWDCRPWSGGSATETCSAFADGDPIYAMVLRYEGDGEFDLTATSESVPELAPGEPVIGTAASGQGQLWKVIVPEGSSHVTVAMAGDAPDPLFPDADLYVSHGSIPTLDTFDCRPWTYGSTETCTFDDAAAELGTDPTATGHVRVFPYSGDGQYFVMVYGFMGPADFVLTAAVA